MITGETPQDPLGYALHNVNFRVSTHCRTRIDPEIWRLDIMSPFWRIYVQNRPGARLYFDSRSLELNKDSVYIVPAWLRFQTDLQEAIEQDYIHYYVHGIPPAFQRRIFPVPLELPLTNYLRSLVERWQQCLVLPAEKPALAGFCLANALVHSCMAEIFTGLSESSTKEFFEVFSDSGPIRKALLHIEENISCPPTNAKLAFLCNLSEDHFIRIFRAQTGVTPAQYGLDRRVDVATELLADTKRSIADIAEATGFVDRFHLSRVIKQRIGVAPALYRRRFS